MKWAAFGEALGTLERRIKIFMSLPLAKLDRMTTEARLHEIGKTRSS